MAVKWWQISRPVRVEENDLHVESKQILVLQKSLIFMLGNMSDLKLDFYRV